MARILNIGLATKLNALIVVMILATSVGVASILVREEMLISRKTLYSQGTTLAMMLSANSEYGVYTANRDDLLKALDNVSADQDVAYAVILDQRRSALAHKLFQPGATVPVSEPPMPETRAGGIQTGEWSDGAVRYVDIMAPVGIRPADSPLRELGDAPPLDGDGVIGYVRLGMSQEGMRQRVRGFVVNSALYTALLALIGMLVTILVTRKLVAPIRNLSGVAREIASGNPGRRVEIRSSGEIRDLSQAFNLMVDHLRDFRTQVEEYQRTLEDKVVQRTHELQAATERAFRLAQHDTLTGLANRAMFDDRLRQALAQASRQRYRLALLFLDLDHFKRINDSLGHDAGDVLLKGVSARLTACVRDTDTVARLGGDEFIVIIPGIPETQGIHRVRVVAQKVLDVLSKPFELHGQEFNVSCSLGVSVYPDDGGDAATLVKHADTAMYSAKEQGRGTFKFYISEMNARVVERVKIENDLRHALANDEFFLVYQPKIELPTRQIVGVEALLRWKHPESGLIPPDKFIPVAEESGLILQIGEWVLMTACRQMKAWVDHSNHPGRVAVNLSIRQFEQQDIVARVQNVLARTGLDGRYLELELTESLIIGNAERGASVLRALKQLGISISMDDFGMGYSSLSYLTRFPIDNIKIDKSFVRDVNIDSAGRAIVDAIIAMAHSLKIRVVAEGVEYSEQLEYLATGGCEEGQGYLFSKPLLPESVFDLFDTWRGILRGA